MRGACEYLLPCCASYIDQSGKVNPMSESVASRLRETIDDYAGRSFRVLVHCQGDEGIFEKIRSDSLSDATPLTFVALYVIRDEIRIEAISAVRECREAGIQVVMLTGDSHSTAAGIGMECGILSPSYRTYDSCKGAGYYSSLGCDLVIDGHALKSMSDGK